MWFELTANGNADEDFDAWDDEVDVDLLLAAFDDPEQPAPPSSTRPTPRPATA